MAEQTVPNTGDPRIDAALERIRGKFTDLEDAMIVQAHLEKSMSSRLKEHAELIADHHDFIKSQQAALSLHTQKMGEFDEKLNALIDIISRMQGGMESRPS
jgi:hypothetical protein